MKSIIRAAALGGLCLLAANAAVQAQGVYPSELVKIVVPYPPGGGIDFLGRSIADQLAKRWNQKVIVENRPGASGVTGAELVAASPPDGYSLLVMPLDTAIHPMVFSRPASDPLKNLTPIAALAASTQVIAANPQSGIASVEDLIKRAKAEPGKLSFASCGNGSPGELIGEQLKRKAGVDLTHVPYKGCAPAVADAMGGHVSLVIAGAGTLGQQVAGGQLKGLAVASDERDPVFAALPTLTEAGLKGIVLVNWFALFGPPGMPAPVVEKIYAGLQDSNKDEEYRKGIQARSLKLFLKDPASFKAMMAKDVDEFGRLLQELNKEAK
jgi:tripartite-type tricarboxylate transporter receptor subunit TctC